MRKTLITVALTLALCPIAFAGEVNTPPVAPEPQMNSAQEQSTDDNILTDNLIRAVLDVIVSVLP
jgi:hypothetical protein